MKVSFDANGGECDLETKQVTYLGMYGELPTATRPGYALEGWRYLTDTGALVGPDTVVSNANDHALVATWTNASYKVTYLLQNFEAEEECVVGPTFSLDNGDPWPALYVPTAEELQLVGLDEHNEFLGWMQDWMPIAEGETAVITEDTVLVAAYQGESCTIEFNVNGGFLDPDQRTWVVAYGDYVEEFPEPEREGWNFVGWYKLDGTKLTDGYWTTTDTTELIAKWVGTTKRTMTFYANDASGSSSKATAYYCGKMSFPALGPTREDGATFLGWWHGGVQVTDAQGKPLEGYVNCWSDDDMDFIAHWSMPRDMFEDAYALTNGVTNVVIGVEASDEDGEPDHDDYGELRATHWYIFEATNGIPVKITFEDLSDVDWPCAALAVYTGETLDDLLWIAGTNETDSFTATLEFTPEATGKYYLVVAQSKDDESALSAYSISATGTSVPKWNSAWTNPKLMPGDTAKERNENALLNDGFSSTVAARVSETNAYSAFTAWAGVGKEATEIPPENINRQQDVILASAYGMYEVPTGSIAVVEFESTNVSGVAAMRITLQVTGELTEKHVAQSMPLLTAALGITGSPSLTNEFSSATLDHQIRAVDLDAGEVRFLVTPKDDEQGNKPAQFFFKPVSY